MSGLSSFFAYMSRMRYIQRWSLMRNSLAENVQEHALQTSMIAHALAAIRNTYYGGDLNADHVAVLAMYHDASEVITGDMATPIKNYNQDIHEAYKNIENMAQQRLLEMLPEALKGVYRPLLMPCEETEAWRVVKAADTLAAYLKCVEEVKMGNGEFSKAHEATRRKVEKLDLPEVRHFLDIYAPGFALSLDELND